MSRTLPRFRFILVCTALMASGPVDVRAIQGEQAQDTAALLYQNRPYGSQVLFNPLTVLLNKGFDIVQLSVSSRYIWDFPYQHGFSTFFRDVVTHPIAAIERDPGWSGWLRTEVLPLSIIDARWSVNWTEHFIGGGITHRSLTEWFRSRGFPLPKVLAGTTTMAAGILNEVMEHPGVTEATSSSVADIWLFDLGGVLFFSWDRPAEWAAKHLRLADWSSMASFTLPGGELENNGQYFVLKAPLPWEDKRLFVRFGLGIQMGISQALDEERTVSLALGMDTRARIVDRKTGRESIEMMLGGGVYLDRNNSLLVSLTMSAAQNKFALNLYPGLNDGLLKDVGAWLVYTIDDEVRFGIVHRRVLGVGLGFGQRPTGGR